MHGGRWLTHRDSGHRLDAAVIGKGCLVGAGAIVTERKVFADGSLILGAPAKVVRELTAEEQEKLLNMRPTTLRAARIIAIICNCWTDLSL